MITVRKRLLSHNMNLDVGNLKTLFDISFNIIQKCKQSMSTMKQEELMISKRDCTSEIVYESPTGNCGRHCSV